MIPAGVKVFLASHPVDFRKGPTGFWRWCARPDPIPSAGLFTSSGPSVRIASRSSGGTARASSCTATIWVHTTALSVSAEDFGRLALVRRVALSTRRFHRLHCFCRLASGTSYRQ